MSQSVQPEVNGKAISLSNPLPVEIIGGGVTGGGGSTAGLATTAKQDALLDSSVRESATLQNVLVQLLSIGPARLTSFVVTDVYEITQAHNGLAIGDVVLHLQTHEVSSGTNPALPYFTAKTSEVWFKSYNAATSQPVQQTLGAAIDTNKATQTAAALITRTSSERTVTRRVLDANLVETFQDSVETKTVHASHLPPYLDIFDSGWV
jgi:hypothetical protein